MLIIPLEKSIDWRRPPVVTLLLVLINGLVLFGLQGDDDAATERAVNYYLDSKLPRIEFPAYLEYVQIHAGGGNAQGWNEAPGPIDTDASVSLLLTMEGDAEFMRRLRAGEVITGGHPLHARWARERAEFDALWRHSITWRYGFVPAEHRLVSFFTYMFLHGGLGHLLGNMVFLVLIGFALEMTLGSILYGLLYLAGGLFAVLLYWAVYPHSTLPLVGASGAIAALMGLYATIFGLRRIRFFYSVLFFFDFVKAPALIMLPLWLANELYQLYWGGVSNVAYAAHIGGLVAGGALGLAVKQFPLWVDTRYLDASAEKEKRTEALERGLKLLASLEVEKAKSVFRALHANDPDDREALVHLYKAEKLTPNSDGFHSTASKVLALPGEDHDTLHQIHETFCDYVTVARGKIRVTQSQLLVLATRFMRVGYLEAAERIVLVLAKGKPAMAGLDKAMLALAKGWHRASNPDKHRQYLGLLLETFPDSEVAAGAREQLARLCPATSVPKRGKGAR